MGGPDAAARTAALATEIRDLLNVASKMVAPMLPRVASIYSPETCAAVGGAVAPVCVKRGWLQGGITGGWGEEISAAVVIVPLSIATYYAARADVDDWDKKPPAQGAAQVRAPAEADDDGLIELPPGVDKKKVRPVIVHPAGAPRAGWEQAPMKRPEETS
jgi:hypothetical protein